ncbi:YIP1 family protein [Treponema phagedenis]|uniref:YIP1 family protein n=1 Tax=Treponema phagedenis TaxID=162 RepID=UPI000308E9DC|nr:YIP1 family protein [Treponema phagedenis]
MKRFRFLCIPILLLSGFCFADPIREGSSNYIYSEFRQVLPAPPAYVHRNSITAKDIPQTENLAHLCNVCVSDSAIYVLCAEQLIIFNKNFEFQKRIIEYTDVDGAVQPLRHCSGMFVTKAEDYYIAQAEEGRILHFNADGSLKRILARPKIYGFENVLYRHSKLVVDNSGRIYVVAKGMYEGIVELNSDGSFSKFFGVNKVSFSPVELIWRRLATAEQRRRQSLWLPTDFSNLCISHEGFIFATIQGKDEKQRVKKLNAKGENILRITSKQYPEGDLDIRVNRQAYGIPTGKTEFIAVDSNESGVFILLDSIRSRVFAYNEDGTLLFIFGGLGDQAGYFQNPVDLSFDGDKIIVLDALSQSIEVFEPTEYGKVLNEAVFHQYNFNHTESMKKWQEVLHYNHNFPLAYSGMGRAYLRQGAYAQSLEYLQLGGDRVYYSKSFAKVRNQKLQIWFPVFFKALIAIALVKAVYAIYRKKHPPIIQITNQRVKRFIYTAWKFPMRILGSPFKTFGEIKHEGAGSYGFAFFVLCFSALLNIMEYVYTGFLINNNDPYKVNSLFLAAITIFPVALFIVANWSVTTLLDGKGHFKEIFLVTMYALFPFSVLRLISLGLSNVLIMDEISIATTISVIGAVMFVFYLFIGLVVIHDYSFSKSLAAVLLTIVSMMVITFILMIMMSLAGDVAFFITTLVKEILLKYF